MLSGVFIMENLVYKTQKGNSVTNSLLVAEKFSKEHKHVLESIRLLMRSAEKAANFFAIINYTDSMNRNQEMFVMNRDGFSLLVMGFTGEKALQFKIEFIEAFNQMETQLKSSQTKELSRKELALMIIEAETARELAEIKIKELEPKAEVFDKISDCTNLKTVGQVAKDLGTGQHRLFAFLRGRGIIMPGKTLPYQRYIDQGYFEVKTNPVKCVSFNYSQTFVTAKG